MQEGKLYIDSDYYATPLEAEIFEKISPASILPEHLEKYYKEIYSTLYETYYPDDIHENFSNLSLESQFNSIFLFLKNLYPDFNFHFRKPIEDRNFNNNWYVTINKIDGEYCIECDFRIEFSLKHESNKIKSFKISFPNTFESSDELVIHAHKIPKAEDIAKLF